jgi:hypothetical protein
VTDEHLSWISNYIEEKRPSRIINLGDFTDMTSLSGYAVGKASAEGKRYCHDVACSKRGNEKLTRFRKRAKKYNPGMDLVLGNHEHRITREADAQPKFAGTLSVNDLAYESFGWKVHPFLRVIKRDGIQYSHYFVSGAMGRPVSSAAALLRTRQSSAVMGHVQRLDLAVHPNTQFIGLFAGICYLHDEEYLTEQGQNTKRGIWMLHEIHDGTFDPMFVSLGFLKRRYS